jgi:peptidoglycan/LPS O-acetylase OafA/YrhL
MSNSDGMTAPNGLTNWCVALLTRSNDRPIAYLNVFRGLAILMVVAAHFTIVPNRYSSEISVALANCGVILFFFLSGFLMDQILVRDSRFVTFAFRRAFRILPMYWLSILLVFVSGTAWTLRDVVANATFTAPVLRSERMLGVYWTLYVEVLFYAIVPFVRYAGERAIKWAPYFLIFVFCVIFGAFGAINNASFYIVFCFAGMQIGAWSRNQITALQLAIVIAAVCISASTLTGVGVYFGLAPLLCALVFVIGMRFSWTFLPLEIVGNVSYSWYLLHPLIGYWIVAAGSSLGSPNWLAAIFGIVFSLIVSAATFLLIERPALTLGRFLTRKKFNSAGGSITVLETSK